MTVQRRDRRRSPAPDQQDRLRALTADSPSAARRLRGRIPRPPSLVLPPSGDAPAVPSAPYAEATATGPYRPRPPGSGSRGPSGRAAPPAGNTDGRADRPVRTPSGPASAPWPERAPDDLLPLAPSSPAAREETAGTTPREDREPAPAPWREPAGHRRPPPGYSEFPPKPPASLLERLSRGWSPSAVLSRRAVVALLVLGAAAVALVLFLHERPTTVPAPETAAPATAAPVPEEGEDASTAPAEGGQDAAAAPEEELTVHVGGEVAEPGLYTLAPGSRVADAVEEAGGALPGADLDLLNLARPLVDGEQVLVGVPPPPGQPGSGPQEAGGMVDINRADKATLETLPGVGAVIADNIIAHREENGPFTSVDDLIDVNRIGEKVLAGLRDHVTVG